MIPLNLPPYPAKITSGPPARIFDDIRRRHVVLTPEEWVRQHFVHYLTGHLGYPAALLANEVSMLCGRKRLRADSVLYDRQARPVMIVEYKAPDVPLTQRVMDQLRDYALLIGARFLTASNGLHHCCCRREGDAFVFLDHIPRYDEVCGAEG